MILEESFAGSPLVQIVWQRLQASAAAVRPSLSRDTTLPMCSYAFTIGKFRRWWYSSPSCWTGGGRRLTPSGLSLRLALDDADLHLNQLAHQKQGPAPISSPMKLHRSLLFASSTVFVSPVQLPYSRAVHVQMVFMSWLSVPQGREQGRVSKRASTPARQSTLKYPILRRYPETTRNCHN